MSESGPDKPLMRVNTGVQDALLHDPKQSPYAYQAPMTACSHIAAELVFRPLNTVTRFGSTMIYELSKVADLLGPTQMVINLAPLIQPDDVGNYTAIRYINNLGIGMIDEMRISYGSNLIVNIPPEWMYVRYRKYRGLASSRAWRVLSRMDQLLVERDDFASTGGEVTVDLCLPWADDTSQFFTMVGMSDKLRITIRLKTLDHLLNYDKTDFNPPATQLAGGQSQDLITDVYLKARCIHLTGAERDTVVANVKSSDGQAKLIEDIQSHIRAFIPTSPTAFQFRLPLTNITGAVRSLFWFLEDPKNTSGSSIRTINGGDWPLFPEPELGRQVGRYAVSAGQLSVIPWTSSVRSRYYHHTEFFSGVHVGEYIFPYSFSEQPQTPNASLGTLNFGQAEQPTLIIDFPNGLNNLYDPYQPSSQGAYLNVLADTCNFVHEQGGDFIKTFN